MVDLLTFSRTHRGTAKPRRVRPLIIIAGVLLEIAAIWRRTGRLGGNVVVRCREGHLFTTIWIPAASVKSLRLGWWRFQRCPVGKHWSLVTPMRDSDLTEEQKRAASEHRDIRLP